MRALIVALAVLSLAEEAAAGDFLRGSYNWGGFYGGVQAGYAIGSADFGNGASSLIAFILRNTTLENEAHVSSWTTLSKADTVGPSYGGFVGYNSEWGEVILGFEGNYNRTSLAPSSSDSLARSFQTSDHYFYNVNVSASDTVHVTDYGTIRFRAGWEAGCFLPYAFAGVAIGRADVTRSATVGLSAIDLSGVKPPIPFQTTTKADTQLGAFAYGWAAGLGTDFALAENVFVRGEWEWIQFAAFKDQNVHISTVRGAVGLKF